MKSERLYLRKIDSGDLAKVHEGLSHSDVIRYYGVSYDSLESTLEQMKWFKDLEDQRKGQWWAVCSPNGSSFYGAGGFHDWDHLHRKAEIGFWLLPQFWGNGFMTEAMPLICEYGFAEMKLHRIEGFVESQNSNCKRALGKLGFVHEGCMRDCEYKNDRYISIEVGCSLVVARPTRRFSL